MVKIFQNYIETGFIEKFKNLVLQLTISVRSPLQIGVAIFQKWFNNNLEKYLSFCEYFEKW